MKRIDSRRKKIRDAKCDSKYYSFEHEPPSKHAVEHFRRKPDYKIYNSKEKGT